MARPLMDTPLTIVILAAGLGTRMKSRKAKVLHQAGGKTLVEHVVDTALELTSPESVIVVVGHQADTVRSLLARRGVRFALQTEQKGTGHALKCCESELEHRTGRLVVLYGDTPLLRMETVRKLIELQGSAGAAAAAITTVLDEPHGYGRIVRNAAGEMVAVVEEKAATLDQKKIREINAGIYCFDAGLLWRHIGSIQTNNPAGEYYLTDMVEILNGAGGKVLPMVVEDSSELLGINTRLELATVDRIVRERKARQLMLDGVTIEKPETVTIDMGVKIGPDTVIEPFTRILGSTVIGSDCRVGSCSIIEDSTLEDDVQVGAFTVIGTSHLEPGVRVGPYSRLRLDNHLEAGSQVGNFVELKKTRLGKGTKALHLAYLGDSTIGAKVNIGAGTITCNYDGKKKHQTKIGDGAFVGSNSTLVAPMEIGDGSYVAAGSVITSKVPDDALALGRSRQVVKEEWAKKRR